MWYLSWKLKDQTFPFCTLLQSGWVRDETRSHNSRFCIFSERRSLLGTGRKKDVLAWAHDEKHCRSLGGLPKTWFACTLVSYAFLGGLWLGERRVRLKIVWSVMSFQLYSFQSEKPFSILLRESSNPPFIQCSTAWALTNHTFILQVETSTCTPKTTVGEGVAKPDLSFYLVSSSYTDTNTQLSDEPQVFKSQILTGSLSSSLSGPWLSMRTWELFWELCGASGGICVLVLFVDYPALVTESKF